MYSFDTRIVIRLRVWFLLTMLVTGNGVRAQNVGVGTSTPHSSAILDVQSTNKGISFPAMTSAQRKAIVNPKVGLLVFDADKNTLYMYDGAQWQVLLFSSSASSLPPIKREADDGLASDFFGSSVSINGNYAVVGAPGDDVGGEADRGSAYVFFRSGSVWTQQDKLTASDGSPSDNFGASVAISGSYIIVGAPGDDGLFNDHGSAYIFIRSGVNWTQQDHVFASTPGISDRFGRSVAISGDYAVVGAPDDDVNGNANQGSAYFFARSGTSWTQQDNVIAPFGDANDNFSASVSMYDDYAIIGAPGDDIAGNSDQGSAHVFFRVGADWTHQATLTLAAGTTFNRFGESVTIYGEWAVAGIPNYGSGLLNSTGAICVFRRTGSSWNSGTLIYLPNLNITSEPEDFFGKSVCMTGDYLIVGAEGIDVESHNVQGASYLFKRNNTNWEFDRKILDPDGNTGDLMGNSVGVAGFNCIIAANGASNNKGKIYFLNVE
jgi:hypothetical protein